MGKGLSSVFVCANCDAQYSKWSGRCLECGKWGTLTKTTRRTTDSAQTVTATPAETTSFAAIAPGRLERRSIKSKELNVVLGGGVVPGSLILLGGEPGIGKSTLALQLAAEIPSSLYVAGEESPEQLKLRADRLSISAPTLQVTTVGDVEAVAAVIEKTKPALAIIDSVQTLTLAGAPGEAGSLSQVRAVAVTLLSTAKKTGVPIILIGQVTKDGAVAGPKMLEHLVDTVLYLEGDRFHRFRVLRAVKNRFGPTDEIGIFSMEEHGLTEVTNPSVAFLSRHSDATPGTAITCLMEGTRPLLIEIQALVSKTNFGYPQRRASGFDLNRLQMLMAILSKRSGLPLESYDVFVNVVGGIEAGEPAADLAVLLAIASATKNKALPQTMVAFGEVGLSGEVRPVSHSKKRLEEIKKMGFTIAVVPEGTEEKTPGLKIAPLKNAQEIVQKILES